MRIWTSVVVVAAVSAVALAGDAPPVSATKQPVELGAVPWLRDFDAAIQRAKSESKPLLVLFQEVPG